MATSSRKSTTGKPVAKKVTLTGNKLEDFLPLLPAEEKLRQNAAAGEECTVDDFDGNRPTKATSINTVRADFLRYMILGGCEKSPVTTFGLRLIGAYVKFPDESLVLDLEATEIPTDIAVYRCAVPGFIELGRADVKSILLDGSNVGRFNASGISTTGSILLRHEFTSKEPVTLVGAGIGGDFDCCGGKFDAPESCLLCDGIVVQGPVFLGDGFEASGLVTFRGAKINGELTCPGGKFAKGIDLRNSEIRNNVWFIEKFESGASIILRNARIGGNLSCQGGTFLDPDNAIIANRARIDGDVDLGNIKSKGTIAFTGSEIGGDFMPQGAILQGTPALQLRNSIIGGTLIWRGLGFVDGEVDLSGTSCKTLNTGHTSWLRRRDKYREELRDTKTSNDDEEKKPVEYHTKLDNFTYEGFSNLPDNVKSSYWIEWLKQQPDEHLGKKFKPRPWEQLASVLDTMGYEEEARDVRIEKQKLHTNFMVKHEQVGFSGSSILHWLQILFRKVFWGPLVAYGYRPGNALIWLFGFVLIGTTIYAHAARQGIMTPTHPLVYKEARANGTIPAWCAENWVYFPDGSCNAAMPSEYSEFQSFVYAADVALPVVNLRMEDDWAPRVVFTDGNRNWLGWWVRTFEWFLIAAGWILSLLFVSAVGSSIRR